MQVGNERAEHVVDRDQEQGKGLRHAHGSRVHTELGPLRVAAEHEVVGPEQQLRKDGRRGTGDPVPDQLADLPRLRGQRREPPSLSLPHEPAGRRGQDP